MPQTITEKIIAAHAAESAVSAGGIATVTPDVLMLNDVSGPLAFDQFEAIRPAAPGRVVLVDGAAARRRGCGHSRRWRADGAHASDSRGTIRSATRGKKWLTPG
jgi:hypothetical protein